MDGGIEAGKTRVLVVEDEVAIAEEIIDRVEGMGFDVPATASSGEDAVKKAEEARPDLVLMDIKLEGGMDGIEAAGRIRRMLDVPVIYLTAFSDRETLERAKVTEPFGYIIKPFEDHDLRVSIELALYKHGREKEQARKQEGLAVLLDEQHTELEVSRRRLKEEAAGRMTVEKKLSDSCREIESNVVGRISHNLQNPLTVASAALKLAQSENDWKKKKFLGLAYSTLERQISALGRMATAEGNGDSVLGKVNLADAAEIVIDGFRPLAARHHLGLEVKIPGDLAVSSVDCGKLLYVLRSLLDNAIKFNKEGGRVVIEAHEDANEIRVCVCDTGIGIPEDKQEKVFERFYQVESSNGRRFKGIGIGLTIAKEVVESQGGRIWVERNRPSVGSEFCFTLPVGGGG